MYRSFPFCPSELNSTVSCGRSCLNHRGDDCAFRKSEVLFTPHKHPRYGDLPLQHQENDFSYDDVTRRTSRLSSHSRRSGRHDLLSGAGSILSIEGMTRCDVTRASLTEVFEVRSMKLMVRMAEAAIFILSIRSVYAVPSFARQTGLSCNVCHSNPPQLTEIGRAHV